MKKLFPSRKTSLNLIILFSMIFVSIETNIVKSNQRKIIGLNASKKEKTLELKNTPDNIYWEKIKNKKSNDLNWQIYHGETEVNDELEKLIPTKIYAKKSLQLNSLNRSIVFDNEIIIQTLSNNYKINV